MAVCESTGGYERLLVSRLRKTGVAVHLAHPNRVHAFAKACGYEAKTDPRDAQVLSRYGQVFPEPDTPDPGPGTGRAAGLAAPAVRGIACAGTQPLGQGHLADRRHIHQAPYRLAG